MSELKKLKADSRGLTILYVEDNKSLRDNASVLLSKFFDTLYLAKDGQKGLELFKKFHPDIIITDIKMPNMDGFEFASHVRKLSSRVKIIIMSAFDDKDNLHKGIDIGISGFLTKPVSMANLVEVLQRNVDEINLLKLSDENESRDDGYEQDIKSMFELLEAIKNSSEKVRLYNYYKGLSITHEAIINEVKDNSIVVTTTYLQEKAVQLEKKTIIVSQRLPFAITCEGVVSISFQKQNIEFTKMHFVENSAVQRETVRVVPEDGSTVSLFLGDNKCQGEVRIEDISVDAIKLKLNYFPAGLKDGDKVILDIVLTTNNRPLLINTEAIMLKKTEAKNSFSAVFTFLFALGQKSILVDYITSREMHIIKEFKSLQNGYL